MEPVGHQLSVDEVTRVATRIALSSWSKMEQDSATLDEMEVMRNYICRCPYVSPDSQAISLALSALNDVKTTQNGNGNHVHQDSGSSKSASPVGHELEMKSENAAQTQRSVSAKKKKRRSYRKMGVVLRSFLLDMPLALIFAVYIFIVWVHRVHDLYLKPEHDAMVWDEDRMREEMTYYTRWCEADDMTTTDGHYLFLDDNATPEDAYEHQLQHGFTVFPGVLSDETATALRNYVVSRNKKLDPSESIFVIENKNRYSFGLGTEEPSVVNAMMELASNERLRSALEKILGKNPALIEMTAITSVYGAVDQFWHDDVVPEGSAIQFSRAFGPSYSVFVPLQNTTKGMGATTSCPGTHTCPAGTMERFCQEEGFQLVNEDGFWRAGDALLMNMNSWHRGAAHTDPDAPDRVMLILTFLPKPRTRSESRQMSQGITFSLRWDMWGHTLDDLANAKTAMWPPLATLRALSLYKPRKADWGIDYVTGSLMRIANHDNGFRRDELDVFIERGGFKWLPRFLHGEFANHESWYEFLLDTMLRCEDFARDVNKIAVSSYLAVFFLFLVGSWMVGATTGTPRKRCFGSALLRLACTHGGICLLFLWANRHVDQTKWAADVRAGRMYINPYGEWENEYEGPTAFPWRDDVLIETRFGSDYLAMYNDFIGKNHPGNRKWNSLVSDGAKTYASYSGLSRKFRDEIAKFIVNSILNNQGRFLYQSTTDGSWMVMSTEDAVKHTRRELKVESNPILRKVNTELGFLLSECKFGNLRHTALSRKFTFPFLKSLKAKLVADEPSAKTAMRFVRVETVSFSSQKSPTAPFRDSFQIPVHNKFLQGLNRKVELHVGDLTEEPYPGAWMQAGDDVELLFQDAGVLYWMRGHVNHVSSTGQYQVEYADGDRDIVYGDFTRWFEPYYEDEVIEVSYDGAWRVSTIVSANEDGTHTVRISEDGTLIEGVGNGNIRRRH